LPLILELAQTEFIVALTVALLLLELIARKLKGNIFHFWSYCILSLIPVSIYIIKNCKPKLLLLIFLKKL